MSIASSSFRFLAAQPWRYAAEIWQLRTAALSAALLVAASGPSMADELSSVAVDLKALPTEDRPAGTVARLAEGGVGPVMLRAFSAGEATPPHRTKREGVRIAVVISGTLSHGVGETADPSAETAYNPGDVLLLPSHETYWLAAREGDASVMFIFADPSQLAAPLLDQMR